jgi:hypothetical protein
MCVADACPPNDHAAPYPPPYGGYGYRTARGTLWHTGPVVFGISNVALFVLTSVVWGFPNYVIGSMCVFDT